MRHLLLWVEAVTVSNDYAFWATGVREEMFLQQCDFGGIHGHPRQDHRRLIDGRYIYAQHIVLLTGSRERLSDERLDDATLLFRQR